MTPVLPGSVVGVLGSGQLGRMFAIAARRMGYRVHTFSPDYDTPTGQIADVEVSASYDDLDAVREFARNVDVLTFEFENVPAATAATAAEHTIVRPAGEILHITQNRLREKAFLTKHGFPVTPFQAVRSAEELGDALSGMNGGAVLKTAGWGYDGKGQLKLKPADDPSASWKNLGTNEAVLEELVDFECEASVIAARGSDGQLVSYPMTRNDHVQHILDLSTAPCGLPETVITRATSIARAIADQLQFVGVLCVEYFVTRQGQVLVNELAPRPHNSGHWTFDGCVTSQFEQQLRAVCGLPLGSIEQLRPAAMANLLGDLWEKGEPDWQSALKDPRVKLHLYGKLEPRPGRKMGHLTALAETTAAAAEAVIRARKALSA
jgi:5-(carboxyamino)imidazole ribonucleotide synthase